MAKTPSEKLFKLVKSLSAPEKRYFKLFVSGKGKKDSKYILLFDAIDAMEVFDEELLKASVYKDKPFQSRKYSELKSYLYDLVLKSLQLYDERTSVDYRLKNMLLNIRVLFRRTHFADAQTVIDKAKKLALKYEDFNTLLELLHWRKEIAYANASITYLEQNLQQISQEEQHYLEQLQNFTTYRNIFLRLLSILRKGSTFRVQHPAVFDEIIQHPLLQDVSLARSFSAKIQYYRILSIHAYATLQWQEYHDYGKLLLEMMTAHPSWLKENTSEYISALSNVVSSCSVLQYYDSMIDYLERFNQIKPNTFDDELKIHRQYYLNKLEWCCRTAHFAEGLATLREHLRARDNFPISFFETSSYQFYYFYTYFGNDMYQEALTTLAYWLNTLKNVEKERQELESLGRMFTLVTHYQFQNFTLVESLVQSIERFLNKQDKVYQYERLLLKVIKTTINKTGKRALIPIIKQTQAQLAELNSIQEEKAMLKYFPWSAWLQTIISSDSFANIARRHYEQESV